MNIPTWLKEMKNCSVKRHLTGTHIKEFVVTHGIFVNDRILFITKGRITKTCNGRKFDFHRAFWLDSNGSTEMCELESYMIHNERVVLFEGGVKSSKLPSYKELKNINITIIKFM